MPEAKRHIWIPCQTRNDNTIPIHDTSEEPTMIELSLKIEANVLLNDKDKDIFRILACDLTHFQYIAEFMER